MKYLGVLPMHLADPCEPILNEYKSPLKGKYKKAARYDKFNKLISGGNDPIVVDSPKKPVIDVASEATKESVKVKSLREKIFTSRMDPDSSKEDYYLGDVPDTAFRDDA